MPSVNTANSMSRRQMLKRCASLTSLMLLPSAIPAFATDNTKKVGLQLYTVRHLMQQSVRDTLQLIAAIGYLEVEFAGYFDMPTAAIRSILDTHGLTAPSVHVPLQQLRNSLSTVIKDAITMGHQYIVLPWLSQEERGNSIENYKQLAAELNIMAKPIQDAGLQLCYHHHDFELTPLQGQLPYDVLLDETDPRLVQMELDVFWAIKAGANPLQLFNRYPGRFPLLHIKDMTTAGDMADVGTGIIDFSAILAKSSLAGVQHRFVEHDNPTNQIQTISQGYKALNAILSR